MVRSKNSFKRQWGDPNCFPLVAQSSEVVMLHAVHAVACGLVVPAVLERFILERWKQPFPKHGAVFCCYNRRPLLILTNIEFRNNLTLRKISTDLK
jgi:hypothetical protein